MLYRGEDLPFTLDGVVPDIIMNAHAIPSRMTMSQILESVKSKYGCYAGLQDASPFNGDTAEDLQEMLHSMGFRGDGTQIMQCGVTGERLKVPIFIGPTFYQRLKHNAEEKLHARGRGRKDFLTRQPNEVSFCFFSCLYTLTNSDKSVFIFHRGEPMAVDCVWERVSILCCTVFLFYFN